MNVAAGASGGALTLGEIAETFGEALDDAAADFGEALTLGEIAGTLDDASAPSDDCLTFGEALANVTAAFDESLVLDKVAGTFGEAFDGAVKSVEALARFKLRLEGNGQSSKESRERLRFVDVIRDLSSLCSRDKRVRSDLRGGDFVTLKEFSAARVLRNFGWTFGSLTILRSS